MLDEEEYASDTDDEDYRPSDGEAVSEEDGSGEEEDSSLLKDGAEDGEKPKKKGKRRKKQELLPRKRRGGIQLEDAPGSEVKASENQDDYNKKLQEEVVKEKEEVKQKTEKQRADDLWASFMSDVGTSKPKPKPSVSSGLGSLAAVVKNSPSRPAATNAKSPAVLPAVAPTPPAKVTITKEYDFAGETVRVTKEVDANSKEAQVELSKKEEPEKSASKPVFAGAKRPGGGLGSVLGKIEKKNKISTLDKSKLDWEKFKSDQGIEEELQIHNRGKEGYVERQQFLQRADIRQFELERDLRLKTSKR